MLDLIHLDWEAQDRENFFAAAKVGLKDLLQSGFPTTGKYEIDTVYLGYRHHMIVTTLTEVPNVMYQTLLRQVVVNNKQIAAHPWEEHLKEALGGSLPDIPEAGQLDASMLHKIRGSREIVHNVTKDCSTYDAMARELRLARESLYSVDPYFYLEEDFFVKHVPSLVEKHVYDKVLATLPSKCDPMDASSVTSGAEVAYKAIACIHAGAMVRHSLPAIGKAVNGAMMILRQRGLLWAACDFLQANDPKSP